MTFDDYMDEETTWRKAEEAAVRRNDHAEAAVCHARRARCLEKAGELLERRFGMNT